jgi:hypothetical protein
MPKREAKTFATNDGQTEIIPTVMVLETDVCIFISVCSLA